MYIVYLTAISNLTNASWSYSYNFACNIPTSLIAFNAYHHSIPPALPHCFSILVKQQCSSIIADFMSAFGDVAARLKYNSLVNEDRYSDRIRRLAACILMNSLSNLVFQRRKFLWEDKERTKERGRDSERKRGGCRQRRWRQQRRAQEETAGWTGTGNGCEVAATAAGAPRHPRRGSSWFH